MTLVAWRISILWFIAGSIVVFGLNLGVLIWARTQANNVADDGSVILQHGVTTDACEKQRVLNTWAHLLINVLGTIILGGSNYCMQCLSAPTREDVDQAHNQGRFLDIGISSFKNLFQVNRIRGLLWLALGISSMPLHLFYNSVIYQSNTANNYVVFSVANDFVDAAQRRNTSTYNDVGSMLKMPLPFRPPSSSKTTMSNLLANLHTSARANDLVNLTSVDCINSYVQTFQSRYRNLVLVTEKEDDSTDYIEARFWRDFKCYNRQAHSWACGYAQAVAERTCPIECDQPAINNRILDDASRGEWAPLGSKVQYCLAEPTQRKCQLQFNMPIAITIVCLNMFKSILMVLVLLVAFRQEQHPILTIGDAASSFLSRPDLTTRFRCLTSRRTVVDEARRGHPNDRPAIDCDAEFDEYMDANLDSFAKGKKKKKIWIPLPTRYVPTRLHWRHAVSGQRWFCSFLLYAIALACTGGYLGTGIRALTGANDLPSLWHIGIGSTADGPGGGKAIVYNDDQVNLSGAALLLRVVLTANTPQLVLSVLYFMFNAFFTIMLMAHEWSSFATQRKGLRVAATKPAGAQRNSYWLQLPFRWSLPLIVCSIALHWLVSQSIFIVNINLTDYDGVFVDSEQSYLPQDETGHLLSLGYSPMAIILVLLVAAVLLAFLIGLAFLRRFASAMPLVATNSAAISAACHTIHASADIASLELRWGDTGKWPGNELEESRILLRDNATDADVANLSFRARYNLFSEYSLAMNPGLAEDPYGDEASEVDIAGIEGPDYWHCGFSSAPVDNPVEGRVYL